ncbi:hypothetical protein AB2B41_20840 [Marimonas sp. MJW-29]|uniref:Uncharacterized protein n=1 Tax=Sulfitobacter sediminis TaxID=3234186 RepID=A0ABV3RST8_9RHOB
MGQVAPQDYDSSIADRLPLTNAIDRLCNVTSANELITCGLQLDEVSVWQSLKDKIDEIILPRELTLSADAIASARLFVSRRKLRAIHLLAPVEIHLCSPPASAAEFAALIEQICSTGRTFALQPTGRGENFRDFGTGCTGQQLLEARQCETLTSDSEDRFSVMSSIAESYLVCDLEGHEQLCLGEERLVNPMRRVHASEAENRASQFKLSESKKDAQPTCFILPFTEEISILSARAEARRAIFAVRTERVGSALEILLRG